ncbi:MAG: hypothetical protein EBS06_05325 [Proteobacteria bacterium]|nr:hypothetical protein [Pseudomonadota bacterium]
MAYHFEEDEALEFGDREAILIYNFRFWIRKNKANGKHFHDGRTWTYNKLDAFPKLFRFWTPNQIRRLIDSLVDQKVLIKGNYNSNPHDRTCWYAFTDENKFLREKPKDEPLPLDPDDLANSTNASGENNNSICEKDKMDLSKDTNGDVGNDKYKQIPTQIEQPNKKPDTGTGSFSEKVNDWSVEEVIFHLVPGSVQIIKDMGYDYEWLIGKYVDWINKNEAPKDFNAAFPAWAQKFTKKEWPKFIKSNPESKVGRYNSFEEESSIRTKIKFLIGTLPGAQLFALSPLIKTANSWKIQIPLQDYDIAIQYKELMEQINVMIEIK